MAYDDVLEIAGNGAFQWRLLVVFFINGIPNAIIAIVLVFLHYVPFKHRCAIPETITNAINESSSLWNATLDFMIPFEEETGERSRCRIYNRSEDEVDAFLNRTLTGDEFTKTNDSVQAVTCGNGWFYHREYNIESAAIEFGWVCDHSWLKPLASSLFIVGVGIGSFAGFFSDRYGRRPIFLIFTFLQFVAFFVVSFAASTWMYIVFMLLNGCVSLVNFMAGFIIAAECTMPNKRNLLSISSFFSFSAGYALASLSAYLIPNWRWLLRCYGFFGILLIPNIWLVPESPRWLMSKGRVDEAKRVLIKMAAVNGRADVTDRLRCEIEKEAITLMEKEGKSRGPSNMLRPSTWNTMKGMVKSPAMSGIVLVLIFSWFCAALVYYGIALNVQAFTGNMYINNLLVGLMEIPALIGAYLTVRYLSRPLSHGGSMIISGIFCMGAGLLNTVSGQAATIAGLLGKAINSGAFYLVYIHTTETSPTLSRNSCMCIGSLAGRIGSFISPYFAYLVELYGMFGPYLTMSLVTIASGILTLLFVPETRLAELPETVQDSLALETIFSRVCLRKRQDRRDRDGEVETPLKVDDDQYSVSLEYTSTSFLHTSEGNFVYLYIS